MINKIFWDIDETLIHTVFSQPDQKHIRFSIDDHGLHYSIIRPCAKRLIEFSRKLIGEENVFILTAATKDYVHEINTIAEWNFKLENIFSREDLSSHYYTTAYGGGSTIPSSEIAHIDNVLIDNLDPRYNSDKISFLGIWPSIDTNYFKVRDYYGTNFPNDTFENDVIEFLIKKQSLK